MAYMRIFILISLFFSIFSFCAPINAQEEVTETPDSQQQIEESDVFSDATDEQITESQIFYESCTENEIMNVRKDCKCAATKYLETRISLGDEATKEEIITANINTCLKDEDSVATQSEIDDVKEVTDKQLDEAELMLAECKSTLKLSRYYDCECYAAKFLAGRMSKGPFASKEEILIGFQDDCRNIVETTGIEYSRCMSDTLAKPPRNGMSSKAFCECYARKWADLFRSYKGRVNRHAKRNLRLRAKAHCRN